MLDYEFETAPRRRRDGTSAEGVLAIVFNTHGRTRAFFTPVPGGRPRRRAPRRGSSSRARGSSTCRVSRGKAAWARSPATSRPRLLRSASFRIDAKRPLPVQIDGDVGGETPLDILVRPAAIRVLVPAAKRGNMTAAPSPKTVTVALPKGRRDPDGPRPPDVPPRGSVRRREREKTLTIARILKEICGELGVPARLQGELRQGEPFERKSFRGHGMEAGLEILAEVKAAHGLPLVSDVHESTQVERAGKTLDILQIPAFLCRQTDLLAACAATGRRRQREEGDSSSPPRTWATSSRSSKRTGRSRSSSRNAARRSATTRS